MVEKCGLDPENDGLDIDFINRLISGTPEPKDSEKRWMFEIVCNQRNSFDVDKLDYLSRDKYHCGLNQQ